MDAPLHKMRGPERDQGRAKVAAWFTLGDWFKLRKRVGTVNKPCIGIPEVTGLQIGAWSCGAAHA